MQSRDLGNGAELEPTVGGFRTTVFDTFLVRMKRPTYVGPPRM